MIFTCLTLGQRLAEFGNQLVNMCQGVDHQFARIPSWLVPDDHSLGWTGRSHCRKVGG